MIRLLYIVLGIITTVLLVVGTWFSVEFISQEQPIIIFFFKWMSKVIAFLLIKMQLLIIAAKALIHKNFLKAVIKTSAIRLAYAATFFFPSSRIKILNKKRQAIAFCGTCVRKSKYGWEQSSVLTKTFIIIGITLFLAILGGSILLLPFAIMWEYLKKKIGQTGVEKAWDKLINGLYKKAPWFKRMMYPFRLIKVYAILTGRRLRIK